jgi:hypothetical protein
MGHVIIAPVVVGGLAAHRAVEVYVYLHECWTVLPCTPLHTLCIRHSLALACTTASSTCLYMDG